MAVPVITANYCDRIFSKKARARGSWDWPSQNMACLRTSRLWLVWATSITFRHFLQQHKSRFFPGCAEPKYRLFAQRFRLFCSREGFEGVIGGRIGVQGNCG